MVEQLFLAMPPGCLRFVIVVFPDHTHLLFLMRLFAGTIIKGAQWFSARVLDLRPKGRWF